MEVGVRVLAEDPMTGERRHCCSAYLTFVALSPEGQPKKLPALELGDESFHRRAKEANIRKAHRLSRSGCARRILNEIRSLSANQPLAWL